MSALHRLRRLVQSAGLDVTRFPQDTPGWRRVRLLDHHGISVVFDVGANDGRYVQELRRFGYRGRAVSFEPVREPYRRLVRNAAHDELWQVLPYAIGAESAQVTINVAANDAASSSVRAMLPTHSSAAPHAAYIGKEEVTQRPLDLMWREFAIPEDASFLKVDVQGYEGEVLWGAPNFISECRGVQLEVSLVPLYEDGMDLEEAMSFARHHDFTVAAIEPGFTDPRSGQTLQVDLILFR